MSTEITKMVVVLASIKNDSFYNSDQYPNIGKKIVLTNHDYVEGEDGYWHTPERVYKGCDLLLLPDVIFTPDDLKSGMIVKLGDGDRYLVIRNCSFGRDGGTKDILADLEGFGFVDIKNLDPTLRNTEGSTYNVDVVYQANYGFSLTEDNIIWERTDGES